MFARVQPRSEVTHHHVLLDKDLGVLADGVMEGRRIFANTLKDKPHLYPDAILWAPNLAFSLIGLWLLWRVTRV